jgi:hypothetical protein
MALRVETTWAEIFDSYIPRSTVAVKYDWSRRAIRYHSLEGIPVIGPDRVVAIGLTTSVLAHPGPSSGPPSERDYIYQMIGIGWQCIFLVWPGSALQQASVLLITEDLIGLLPVACLPASDFPLIAWAESSDSWFVSCRN